MISPTSLERMSMSGMPGPRSRRRRRDGARRRRRTAPRASRRTAAIHHRLRLRHAASAPRRSACAFELAQRGDAVRVERVHMRASCFARHVARDRRGGETGASAVSSCARVSGASNVAKRLPALEPVALAQRKRREPGAESRGERDLFARVTRAGRTSVGGAGRRTQDGHVHGGAEVGGGGGCGSRHRRRKRA